jgi:hypothetical protein
VKKTAAASLNGLGVLFSQIFSPGERVYLFFPENEYKTNNKMRSIEFDEKKMKNQSINACIYVFIEKNSNYQLLIN